MNRLVSLLLLLPVQAIAEVMDKEPSLAELYTWAVVSSLALLLAGRFRPRILPVVAVLPALSVWGQLSEITDRFVGPDILREAGPLYVQVSWALPWPMMASIALGLWLRRRSAA